MNGNIKNRKPKDRPGFKWEYRNTCECSSCPWKGKCKAEDDFQHWIEVKKGVDFYS